jgi:hypothetical protein
MRCVALWAVGWLGLALGCRADQPFQKVQGTTFVGYIIPKSEADGWMRTDRNTLPVDDGQCWVPTVDEATAAEKSVRGFIARAQKDVKVAFPNDPENALSLDRRQLGEIGQKYSRYGVQFIGIVVHGQREIFCNYFCRDATGQLDPSRNFIFMYDGGSCFWRVEYVPATKSCTGLEVNGER